MLAYKDGPQVRLISRNDVDHARRYPDVVAAIARLRVLDGERAQTS
jgi:ATP-dependent DNA ligase